MATIAMKRVQLIGMQRQRKKLLELVQRMGAVEVTEAAEVGFSRSDSAQMRAHLDRCTRTVQQALEILNRYAPEKKSLADTLSGARILVIFAAQGVMKNTPTSLGSAPVCSQY